MYNKRRFNKINDKKVLHKIKKQWVTISLALFMTIGGGALATHTNAHANQMNNHTDSDNDNTNIIHINNNQLHQGNNSSNISSQAKEMHQRLLFDANNQASQIKKLRLGSWSKVRKPVQTNRITVNNKPTKKINNINQLKTNQNGDYQKYVYKRINIPFNTIRITRPVRLHSSINFDRSRIKGILPKGRVIKINRAFKEFGFYHNYLRYEINLANVHNAFITGNKDFVSYIIPSRNYKYYQNKINNLLKHTNNKAAIKLAKRFTKLNQQRKHNLNRYVSLYELAYNTQQNSKHPVIVNYHNKIAKINNSNYKISRRKGMPKYSHLAAKQTTSSSANKLEDSTNTDLVSSSYVPIQSIASSTLTSFNISSSASITPINSEPTSSSANLNSQSNSTSNSSSVSAGISAKSNNESINSNNNSNQINSNKHNNSSTSSKAVAPSSKAGSVVSSNASQSNRSQASSNAVSSSTSSKPSSATSSVNSKSTSSNSSSTNSSHSNAVKSNASNSNSSSNVKPASSASSNSSKTQVINGIYRGLHYSYNPINKFVEFTGGTLDKDSASDFISSSDTPSDIKHSVAVKVDKSVQLGDNNNLGHMFESDSDLISIDLHDWDIHQANNISDMFEGDINLRTVNLSNVDASGVGFPSDSESELTRSADLMFDGDSSLVSINLNGFKAGDTVSSMFSGIPNIKDLNGIDVKDMDLSKTKHMSDMFESDSDLTNVDLHNWDIHQATNINGMFTNDPNLRTVNLSNVDASGVGFPSDQDMLTSGNANAMFEGDGSLESVNLKGFKAGDTVSGMFSSIPHIKDLNGIDVRDMDLSRTKYMDDMFESDSDLTNVDLHNWDIRHAVHIESMFTNDPNLQTVDLSNVNASGVGIHADNRINQMGHPLSDQDAESLFLDDNQLSNVNFKDFKIWHFLDMLPKSLKGKFDKQLSNTIDNVLGDKYGNYTVEPVTNDLERSILFIPTIIMHTFQSSSHFMNPLRNINIVGCTYDHNIGNTNPKCSPGIYGHMSDISDAIDSDEASGSRYGSNSFLGLTFTGITYELLNNSSYTNYGAKFDGIISKESIDDIYSTIGDVLDIFFGTSTIPSTIVDSVKSTATEAVTNSIEQKLPYLGKELCKYFGDAKDAKNVAKYTVELNNNIVKENNPEYFASSTGESLDDVKSDAKSGIRNNCQGIASTIIPLINKIMHDYYFFN